MVSDNHLPKKEDKSAALAVAAFPAVILIAAAAAFFFPSAFTPLAPHVTTMLMIIMFSMDLTLTIPDFQEVARRPIPILIGVVAQFVVMPLGAVGVAKLLGLGPELAIGLLLLGSVPGGTASNVIAYLAKGDVALSVAMTSISTLLSPIMTPLLMLLLAGADTDVNAGGLAMGLVKTVLVPVIGGLVIHIIAPKLVEKVMPVLPWLSIVAIGAVVCPSVAKSSEKLASAGLVLFIAVMVHNLLGYTLGYLAAKMFKENVAACRTMAIEVGTQNSGLATGMAGQFFSPEAALPGAVATVVHNVNGAIIAFFMRRVGNPQPATAEARVDAPAA